MWGEALVIALALGALGCFAFIFRMALAEYRQVDPVDYSTPWGDIIDPADAYVEEVGAASGTITGGAGDRAGRRLRYATHTVAFALDHGRAYK